MDPVAVSTITDVVKIVVCIWGGAVLMAAAIWVLAAWSSLR